MKSFLYLVFGLIILYVLFTYIVLRPRSLDASKEEPFSRYMNKPLTVKTTCILAENPETNPKKFPLIIEDNTNYRMADLNKEIDVPVGSTFTISSVELHTGSVSGTTSAYIFGEITLEEKTYQFEYVWGYYHSILNEEPYWTFDQAFWMENELEERFFIEVP